MNKGELNVAIDRLSECHFPSPVSGVRFTSDDEFVLYHSRLEDVKRYLQEGKNPPAMEVAGPRETHEHGGTILGSSRGPQDAAEMARTLRFELPTFWFVAD